jgi:hypothetical protein
MPYLNHNLPAFDCFIRNEFLYNHTQGHGDFTWCNVHSVASIQGRTPLFEAFLENGVNWTRRPLHAFCHSKEALVQPLDELIYWDCFGSYIDVQVRARLAGLKAELLSPTNKRYSGNYLFTIDWSHENSAMLDTGFSETTEHKCAHVFAGHDGNFYAYPNNRIIWFDAAWTKDRITSNPGYKIDMSIYSVEGNRAIEASDSFIYELTPTSASPQPSGEQTKA